MLHGTMNAASFQRSAFQAVGGVERWNGGTSGAVERGTAVLRSFAPRLDVERTPLTICADQREWRLSRQGELEATPGIEPGYTVLQTVA